MTLNLNEMLNGGLVTEPSSARAIAEVIVADAYGADELERQRPLVVVEEDDRWHVAGSFNERRQCDQRGPVSLWIRKRDAAVLDINMPFIMCVPPDVHEIIDRDMERRDGIEDTDR